MIGRAIDSVIGVFSPMSQHRRMVARAAIARERQYAAAKTPKTSSGWNPVDPDVNTLIATSSPMVRSRVRQLVRDFPYFSRAVNTLCTYTVGSGITLQCRVKNGDALDRKLNSSVEEDFERWSEKADVSGKLHFNELTDLAKRNELETGESIFVKRYKKGPGRIIPYSLQAMEPERLVTYGVKPREGNIIQDGIEIDSDTGEPKFYHFSSNDFSMKPVAVPASDVIHEFRTLRPGQVRGISSFTPVVLLANNLYEFMENTLDRSRLAANWLAFVKTPNPYGMQNQRGVTNENGKRIEEIENLIIEYLNPGEEIEFSNGSLPGETFEPYVKLVLHMVAVGTEVPYELLTEDSSGINYSTLRAKRNDFSKSIKPHQVRKVRHFCQPVFCDVLDSLVLNGRTKVPTVKYYKDPWTFRKNVWLAPGTDAIDPLKESKANTDQIKSLVRSPQEVCRERGRDLEDVLDELKEFFTMCKDRGLNPSEVSTAIASNPAVLGAEESA